MRMTHAMKPKDLSPAADGPAPNDNLAATDVEQSLPTNWPADIGYIPRPIYSHTIDKETLQVLHTPPLPLTPDIRIVPSSSLPPNPNPHVGIEPISDPNHPAHGQCGLFAQSDLAPDTLVCLYMGLVYTTRAVQDGDTLSEDNQEAEKHATSNYDLSLARDITTNPASDTDYGVSKSHNISIDAASTGNEARFVNDYRGVPAISSSLSSQSSGNTGKTQRDKTNYKQEKASETKNDTQLISGPNVEFREIWIQWSRKHRSQPQCQDDTPKKMTHAPNGNLHTNAKKESASVNDYSGASNTDTNSNVSNIHSLISASEGTPWHGPFERCMALYVLSAGKKMGTRRQRGIKAGEELLVSYGKAFWREREAGGE